MIALAACTLLARTGFPRLRRLYGKVCLVHFHIAMPLKHAFRPPRFWHLTAYQRHGGLQLQGPSFLPTEGG